MDQGHDTDKFPFVHLCDGMTPQVSGFSFTLFYSVPSLFCTQQTGFVGLKYIQYVDPSTKILWHENNYQICMNWFFVVCLYACFIGQLGAAEQVGNTTLKYYQHVKVLVSVLMNSCLFMHPADRAFQKHMHAFLSS